MNTVGRCLRDLVCKNIRKNVLSRQIHTHLSEIYNTFHRVLQPTSTSSATSRVISMAGWCLNWTQLPTNSSSVQQRQHHPHRQFHEWLKCSRISNGVWFTSSLCLSLLHNYFLFGYHTWIFIVHHNVQPESGYKFVLVLLCFDFLCCRCRQSCCDRSAYRGASSL